MLSHLTLGRVGVRPWDDCPTNFKAFRKCLCVFCLLVFFRLQRAHVDHCLAQRKNLVLHLQQIVTLSGVIRANRKFEGFSRIGLTHYNNRGFNCEFIFRIDLRYINRGFNCE